MRSQWDPYLKYLNFKFCQKSVKHSDHVLFAIEFILLGEKKKRQEFNSWKMGFDLRSSFDPSNNDYF